MPNVEFSVPMRLETPGGTIYMNTPDPSTGRILIVRHEGYKIVPTLRVTQDNISQGDGSVLHPRWLSGLVAQFKLTYYIRISQNDEGTPEVNPACGQDLREMNEEVIAALNSIRRYDGETMRYFWQPTGYGDERMIDNIQLLTWPDPSYELDGLEVSEAFSVETPFPYAIDSTELQTDVADGTSEMIPNTGNSKESPVFKLYGPISGGAATIANVTTGLEIVYDPDRAGAMNIPALHYIEIDTFRGTAFYDGDQANLIAGIDPLLSDFFTLDPNSVLVPGGVNEISVNGSGGLTVLSNNAWA